MAQIGLLAVALGIIGLIYGIMMKLKAGRLADAPLVKTGDAAARGPQVASPKGAISAQGAVLCPQPLVSPVSGTPCLYYELKVTASWKDGDAEKSKELSHEKRAADFAIDDGSGPVRVDARSGGDFEPTQTKDETKGTSLLGGITGQDLVFGNYRVSTGALSLGTKYRVEEKVLPVEKRLYVCGKTEGGAITAPGWRRLIASNKSRDELLAHATKSAKVAMIAGAASFAVGAGLATIGALTGGDAHAAPPPSAAATASAAPMASAAESASAAPTASAPANIPASAPVTPPHATHAPATKAPTPTKAPAGKPAGKPKK